METIDIVKGLLDLGITGLLLYFLNIVWKDVKEKEKTHREDIIKKDDFIAETQNKLLDAFNKNTEISTQLKSTIDNQTALTTQVLNVLTSRKRK